MQRRCDALDQLRRGKIIGDHGVRPGRSHSAHRIGQRDSLLCYYLVSPQGSDADIQEALGLKVSQFLGLMGERAPTPDLMQSDADYARRYVEKLLSREV